jgi:hypothetical protein
MGGDSSALYQVALEVPDVPQDLWPFSSVTAVRSFLTNHICPSPLLVIATN